MCTRVIASDEDYAPGAGINIRHLNASGPRLRTRSRLARQCTKHTSYEDPPVFEQLSDIMRYSDSESQSQSETQSNGIIKNKPKTNYKNFYKKNQTKNSNTSRNDKNKKRYENEKQKKKKSKTSKKRQKEKEKEKKKENEMTNGNSNSNSNKDEMVVGLLENITIGSSFSVGNGISEHEIEQFNLHRQRILNMQRIKSKRNSHSSLSLHCNDNINGSLFDSDISINLGINNQSQNDNCNRNTHVTVRSKRYVVSEVADSAEMSLLLNMESTTNEDKITKGKSRSKSNSKSKSNTNNGGGANYHSSNNSNSNASSTRQDGVEEAYDSKLQLQYSNEDISDEKDLCTFDYSNIYSQGSTKIAFLGLYCAYR